MNKPAPVTVHIQLYGVELEVEGFYFRGLPDDRDAPEEPSEFDTHAVFAGGENITELLRDGLMEEINQLALDSYEN